MDPRNDNHPLISLGLECHNADIHSSNVELCEDCPRKFLLSERFHLRPRGTYRSAPELGTFFHSVTEGLIKGQPFDEALSRAAEKRVKLYTDLADAADALGLLPNGVSIDAVERAMQDDFDKAAAMAHWMHHFKPWPDDGSRKEDWTVLGCEAKVRAKFPEFSTYFRGALDCIMFNTKTGEVWIVDHKTTSWDPDVVMAVYKFSIQPRLYIKLLRGLMPDSHIVGVCHNVIQKPTIRLKKNQTMEDYIEELGEWYSGTGRHADKRSSRDTSSLFARSWLRFGPEEYWDAEVQVRIDRAAKMCMARPDLARFPKHSQSCLNYNSLCGYYPLCSTDPITWGTIIPARYEVGHRDDDVEDLVTLEIKADGKPNSN